jgi:TupA-like ATPgrasp
MSGAISGSGWDAIARPQSSDVSNRARRDHGARIRIMITYCWRHGRLPNLNMPTRFTELVQNRKLHDRDVRLPTFADKVQVKDIVARTLGSEWIIPTLWSGTSLPLTPQWPMPFVVKSRHGCNQRAFVRDGQEDWQAIRRTAHRWLTHTYGEWLDEWLYSQIPKGLLVEPFVGTAGVLPIDYKFYVFGGKVEFIQIHLEREHAHRWIALDRNWNRVSAPSRDRDPKKPHTLAAMIEAAEHLGREFDFVRADFYDAGGAPLFGELTFYPGSGLDPFNPDTLDEAMGTLWRSAMGLPTSSRQAKS